MIGSIVQRLLKRFTLEQEPGDYKTYVVYRLMVPSELHAELLGMALRTNSGAVEDLIRQAIGLLFLADLGHLLTGDGRQVVSVGSTLQSQGGEADGPVGQPGAEG